MGVIKFGIFNNVAVVIRLFAFNATHLKSNFIMCLINFAVNEFIIVAAVKIAALNYIVQNENKVSGCCKIYFAANRCRKAAPYTTKIVIVSDNLH